VGESGEIIDGAAATQRRIGVVASSAGGGGGSAAGAAARSAAAAAAAAVRAAVGTSEPSSESPHELSVLSPRDSFEDDINFKRRRISNLLRYQQLLKQAPGLVDPTREHGLEL
jgi:hypothetical protein